MPILRNGMIDPSLIWATPSVGHLYKGHERKRILLFAWLLLRSLANPFLTGSRAYFFGNLMNIEDQLRHPGLWTELLDSWMFCLYTAIVGLAGSQSVSYSNKFCLYTYANSLYTPICISSIYMFIYMYEGNLYIFKCVCTINKLMNNH